MLYADFMVSASRTVRVSDNTFLAFIQRAIDQAEQRMYRELDLLETVTTTTADLTANVRSLAIPGSLVVVQAASVVTPVGSGPDDSGASRTMLQQVSQQVLDFFWPAGQSASSSGLPIWWANKDNTTALFGPAPDDAYTVEFIGTVRPTGLSASNTSTILTSYVPDLFFAGVMAAFEAMPDKPQGTQEPPPGGGTWDARYNELKPAALAEIARKKGM